MMISIITFMLLLLGTHNEALSQTITVSSDTKINNDPVYVDLTSDPLDEHVPVCLKNEDGASTPGQIETLEDGTQRLWWIADVPEGSTVSYEVYTDENCNKEGGFYWKRVRQDATRLMLGGKPVIQYEHPVFDFDDNEATRKPYHHVYDPTGNGLITKGVGGTHSHHRGIFSGFVLFTGEGREDKPKGHEDRINIWAPSDGERSEHQKILKEFSGPVMGGHVLEILWIDQNDNTLIRETRDIRVFKQPRGEVMIDFTSHLRSTAEPVMLSGDAHHGGVHFRAAQYVADNPESTMFIRPEHWSHLPPEDENKGRTFPENLHITPWDAMNFNIRDRMYTTSQFTHPDNPGKGEMGERKYGRIGYFFPHDLTEDNPLDLNYRFWITAGQAPRRKDIDMKYNSYASPPDISISNN